MTMRVVRLHILSFRTFPPFVISTGSYLLSFRPEHEVRSGEIRARSARRKGVDRAMRLDFSTALEMTGMGGRPPLYEPPFSKGGTDCDSKPRGDLPLRDKAGLSESSISKTPTAYRWGQIPQPQCVRQRLARRNGNALLGHRSGDLMPSLILHGKTAHKCCFENTVLVFAKGSLYCGKWQPPHGKTCVNKT